MKNSLRKSCVGAFGVACLELLFLAQNTVSAQTSSQTANRQIEACKTFSPAGKNFKVSLPAMPRELDSAEVQPLITALNSQFNKTGMELTSLQNV